MVMLSDDQVRHVAKLARIELSDEEVKKFSKQLSAVLEYMDVLSEVDTTDVPETSQVTGLKNVMDKDEILPAQANREELLGCSELSLDSKQIKVKRVV
ncbi:Asp-tRNA(Asn)/Glu-tRNA(Gln) amidotransferase subunit GatC [Candidatus Peregrinibacteria bacterium]|nr:Asp-tRNA(Asn)/Glu-tRNA(Gln) amidotransferase subunit GatC [Candidatus Peregrinibacteria bacterium]